jgi:hypothetical protein
MNWIKKSVLTFALSLALPILASAHSVTLSFTKSVDDTGAVGSGYTTWRMSGSCPATAPTTTAGFTSLNAVLFQGNSYLDSSVIPGSYCYLLTFSSPTATSVPSNDAGATVQPAPPTNVITGTTTQVIVPSDVLGS